MAETSCFCLNKFVFLLELLWCCGLFSLFTVLSILVQHPSLIGLRMCVYFFTLSQRVNILYSLMPCSYYTILPQSAARRQWRLSSPKSGGVSRPLGEPGSLSMNSSRHAPPRGHGSAVWQCARFTARGSWVQTSLGMLWALAACSLLRVIAAHTLKWGLTKGPFCVEFACSLRVSLGRQPYPHKNMHLILGAKYPPLASRGA